MYRGVDGLDDYLNDSGHHSHGGRDDSVRFGTMNVDQQQRHGRRSPTHTQSANGAGTPLSSFASGKAFFAAASAADDNTAARHEVSAVLSDSAGGDSDATVDRKHQSHKQQHKQDRKHKQRDMDAALASSDSDAGSTQGRRRRGGSGRLTTGTVMQNERSYGNGGNSTMTTGSAVLGEGAASVGMVPLRVGMAVQARFGGKVCKASVSKQHGPLPAACLSL